MNQLLWRIAVSLVVFKEVTSGVDAKILRNVHVRSASVIVINTSPVLVL